MVPGTIILRIFSYIYNKNVMCTTKEVCHITTNNTYMEVRQQPVPVLVRKYMICDFKMQGIAVVVSQQQQ